MFEFFRWLWSKISGAISVLLGVWSGITAAVSSAFGFLGHVYQALLNFLGLGGDPSLATFPWIQSVLQPNTIAQNWLAFFGRVIAIDTLFGLIRGFFTAVLGWLTIVTAVLIGVLAFAATMATVQFTARVVKVISASFIDAT